MPYRTLYLDNMGLILGEDIFFRHLLIIVVKRKEKNQIKSQKGGERHVPAPSPLPRYASAGNPQILGGSKYTALQHTHIYIFTYMFVLTHILCLAVS